MESNSVFPNLISITACDNQLVFIAYNSTIAYEVCNVQSGYGAPVNATFCITPGAYQQVTPIYAGDGQPIDQFVLVSIPSGQYNLVAFGKNWYGIQEFAAQFNDVPLSFALNVNDSGSGIKITAPITITV
jgi:hypothetical protein